LPRGIAALAFDLAAFGGDALQLAAHALEALLGLAAVLRRRRGRRQRQQGPQREREKPPQAGASRL
jgi:hypothetical protein